jgi:hypothetical protein
MELGVPIPSAERVRQHEQRQNTLRQCASAILGDFPSNT